MYYETNEFLTSAAGLFVYIPFPPLFVLFRSFCLSGKDCNESSAPCESSDGGAGDGKLAFESSFTTVNSLTGIQYEIHAFKK